jgi:excisionase family DNA binding protein
VTEPVYLTPAEVAEILKVHPRTVLRLAQQDATMPATRIGTRLVRFEKAALERWVNASGPARGLS